MLTNVMPDSLPVVYPRWREANVVLRDGTALYVRPSRADDHAALVDFYARLSPESRRFRFFNGGGGSALAVTRLLDIDYRRRYGVVAMAGKQGRLVAHAFYAAGPGDHAEVALAVADDLQGMGLRTILLGHLAQAATAGGIHVFEADVKYKDDKMARVFLDSGFPVRRNFIWGAVHFEFPTAITGGARERFESRAPRADPAHQQVPRPPDPCPQSNAAVRS